MKPSRARQLYWDLAGSWSKRDARRAFFALAGLVGIERPHVIDTTTRRTVRLVNALGVHHVIDVGANIGQFASSLRRLGFRGDITSIEPLPDAHAELTSAASGDTRWHVFRRCAVGRVDGNTDINVSKNSYSSSILPMKAAHIDAAPDSAYVARVATPIFRLETLHDEINGQGNAVFLKIDTQGFEREVLAGLGKAIGVVQGIQLELSLQELYAGQALYLDLLAHIDGLGFEIWHLSPGFENKATGQLLQFDVLFRRKPPSSQPSATNPR